MGESMEHTPLERLPNLVFESYVLKYLLPKDIFNLGRCSKTLKNMVVTYTKHPVSTALQCIKTRYKHYEKISTIYDDIDRFTNIDKCKKVNCECSKFRQRKHWVIMDPGNCPSCDESLFNCDYHCTLMKEIFDLKLCNDCYIKSNFCSSCSNMLDQ